MTMRVKTMFFIVLGSMVTMGATSPEVKNTPDEQRIEDKGFKVQMQEDQLRGAELDKKRRIHKKEEENRKLIQEAEKAMNDEVDF